MISVTRSVFDSSKMAGRDFFARSFFMVLHGTAFCSVWLKNFRQMVE